jgi:hypothetical protein
VQLKPFNKEVDLVKAYLQGEYIAILGE